MGCVRVWLGVMAGLVFGVQADAASRMVVSTAEPVQVYLDGVLVPAPVGSLRCAIPHIESGTRTLAIRELNGVPIHSERIAVADGSDIRIRWSRGQAFEVSGAQSAPVGIRPVPLAPSVATEPSRSSSSTSSSDGDDSLRGATSRVPSAGQVTSIVTGSGVAGLAAGAAASGVRSLTYGAKAGVSFGQVSAPQQRIVKPDVIVGDVVFYKTDGGAIVIYEDGMVVVTLPAGSTERAAKLEVGRRSIEVRSAESHTLLFAGDLTVDRNEPVRLQVSDRSPPNVVEKPWLFKPL